MSTPCYGLRLVNISYANVQQTDPIRRFNTDTADSPEPLRVQTKMINPVEAVCASNEIVKLNQQLHVDLS